MSYQVLARKWRPGRFNELVGQEHVVTAISNALDNNRLHHAYLFTGTRGVGKTTIARIFSKSLNCEEGQGANPCGVCDTCKEIEQGNYVDLLEIDAASRTKVEDTRELLDNVQYKPTRGRYKVYLIDEVHMLSKHSFNALLKTLEEPPPHVKFLLATTDPQKLPVTILSRCLQFNLKALSREQISGQLSSILEQESVSFEPSALALLARAAQGSMRDALSLTDQAIAQGNNQVLASIVTDMLGLMDRHQIIKLLYAIVKKSPQDMMAIVDDMAEQAPDYAQVLGELSSLLHQVALTQWVPDVCKLETTSAKAIYQLAKAMSAEHVQLLYQIALQGKKDLPFAVDGRTALEMTLIRMLSFSPAPKNDGADELIVSAPEHVSLPVDNHTPSDAKNSESTEAAQHHHNLPDTPESVGAEFDSVHDDMEDDQGMSAEQTAIEAMAAELRQPPSSSVDGSGSDPTGNNQAPPGEWQQDMQPASDNHHQAPGEDGGYWEPVSDDNSPSAEAQSLQPGDDFVIPQDDVQQENHTSIEDMLALRQQLKTGRREADETQEKKSANPDSDTVERVKLLSQRRGANVTEESDNPSSSDEREDSHQDTIANASSKPGQMEQSHDVPPPWVTEPEHDQSSDIAEQTTREANSARGAELDAPEPTSATAPHRPLPSEEQVELVSEEGLATHNNATLVSTGGELNAYLEDGSKLTLGRQIDPWSELVSRLGLAGLTKQIVLNASFLREGNKVTLELDRSQDHLLNDDAVSQLKAAICRTLEADLEIDIVLGEPHKTPLSLQADIDAMRQAYARQVVNEDEKFIRLRDVFSAQVLEDTILPR